MTPLCLLHNTMGVAILDTSSHCSQYSQAQCVHLYHPDYVAKHKIPVDSEGFVTIGGAGEVVRVDIVGARR